MPELGEVEFFRRQWDVARGEKIIKVETHPTSRIYRGSSADEVADELKGRSLKDSRTHGKQMHFCFSEGRWMSLHLGMTGTLRAIPVGGSKNAKVRLLENHVDVETTDRHNHLVLVTSKHRLIFSDPRHFGKVTVYRGEEPPEAWQTLPPEVGADAFSLERVQAFFRRRAKAPVKAVLLMQETFPGVGNWMADEILWRAAVHPARRCGTLSAGEVKSIYRETRWVCRRALETIGVDWTQPTRSWLFPHRWRDGGCCPRTGVALVRETIGGRTTCWSPGRQKPLASC